MATLDQQITHNLWAELLDRSDERAFLELTWRAESRLSARIVLGSALLFLSGGLLDLKLDPAVGAVMTAGRVLVLLVALAVWRLGRREARTAAWERVLFAFAVVGPLALFASRTLHADGNLSPGWSTALILFLVAGSINLYPFTGRWLVACAVWMMGLGVGVLYASGLSAGGMFAWTQIVGFICAGTTYRVLSLQRERRRVWRINRDLRKVNEQVTALLEANEKVMDELREQAETDPLTGAFNRRGGEALARSLIARGGVVSVLVVDLDNFKAVNDSWGHCGGDRALCHVTHMMRAAGRMDDLIIRWGGDELVMVIRDPDAKEGHEIGHRVVSSIRRSPILYSEQCFSITVSVGGVTGEGVELDALIKQADQALYVAKERGRDRALFFEELPALRQIA